MKRRYYIIIAVISYCFFALASTPAAKVISLAKNNFNMNAQFYNVEGSIWNGRASSLLINEQRIDQLQWTINPFALLLANVSADVQANVQQQPVIGQINVKANGDIHAKNVRTQFKAEFLQQQLAIPFGELEGEFNLNIESLEWTGTDVPNTVAALRWRNAKLTLVDAVDLGQVLFNINPDDKNGLDIDISNKKGMLSIDGDINIDSQKKYTLQIDLKPESNASSNISQSLEMFAKRQSNGAFRIKQNGHLNQLDL